MVLYWILLKGELAKPLRDHGSSASHYWNNIALNAINFVLIGIFSHFIVGYSYYASESQVGLYNLLAWTGPLAIVLQVVVYDLLSYFIHRLFHSVDSLWSLHRSHHSDSMMDATTGFRFHPGEGVFRLLLQSLFIVVTGMSPYAIVLHSMIAAPVFLISHSNYKFPLLLEAWISKVFVMPREHSIHHHPERQFHDSNYGTIFMFWDRLLGTYTDPATVPNFEVGLYGYEQTESLAELLVDPVNSKQKA
jgi:sterol desaturase/sphingolipid hydroxylase (fatty acid hydroxylase superfamily)